MSKKCLDCAKRQQIKGWRVAREAYSVLWAVLINNKAATLELSENQIQGLLDVTEEMTRKRFMKLAMSGKPFAINRNQAIILARAANMCGLTYENAYMKLLRLADDIQKDVVRAYDRYTLASIQDGVKAQCVTIEIPVKEEE